MDGQRPFSSQFLAPLAMAALSACATLPTNAPTLSQVRSSADSADNRLGYQIVDIDAGKAVSPPTRNAPALLRLKALATGGDQARTDLIRPGDTLAIAVFEVGVALFAGAQNGQGATPTAGEQRITLQVRDDGSIALPYLGTFQAAGTYPDLLAEAIRRRLARDSQSPEVLIAIADTVESAAYLSGQVARPGRYRLTGARERLLDVLALAGGASIDTDDAELRLVRGGQVAMIGLGELRAEDEANIAAQPGDRIEIRRQRRSYTVFGAAERVAQIPFEAPSLSLAEAIARAGGPSDARGNPRGVFLFRFETVADGSNVRPVIYRLNLMQTDSYFLAQAFQMQDKDVLLFANADANLPGKFMNIFNQFASPFVTARVLTK
jgi:polysaccharide biosynthesis/export protein